MGELSPDRWTVIISGLPSAGSIKNTCCMSGVQCGATSTRRAHSLNQPQGGKQQVYSRPRPASPAGSRSAAPRQHVRALLLDNLFHEDAGGAILSAGTDHSLDGV